MRRWSGRWGVFFVLCGFVLCGFGAAAGEEKQMLRASAFANFDAALAAAKDNLLLIDQPQSIASHLIIPEDVHLFFVGQGALQKAAEKVSVSIKAPITAPLRPIFMGFAPGKIVLQNAQTAFPQWWGARANDEQDDSLALQCALDCGANVVHLPQGHYLVNQPLNLTNRPGGGWTVHGDGFAHDRGTILHANTGGVLFDASGSQFIDFRDFSVVSGKTNPSTIAFLFARSAQIEYTKYAQFHSLTNVRVHLASLPEANNGNGTVAVYNYAAELWRAHNIYLKADQPLVFTGYNIFQIKSPFTELWGGYPSMSECTVEGASTLDALDGSCVLIDNGIAIQLVNTYLTGRAKSKNRVPYAIHIRGPGYWTRTFTYTGHYEYSGGLMCVSVRAVNVHIEATGAPKTPEQPVILLDTPHSCLWGGKINYTHINFGQSHHYPLIKATGKHSGIIGVTIGLYEGQAIEAPLGPFQNNILQAFVPYKPKINVEPKASYLLLAGENSTLFLPPKAGKQGN